MLGLGSSDEITVTNVNGAQPDALGGQNSLIAPRRKRAYFRLFIDDDAGNFRIHTTLSAPTCTPVVTHK